MSNTFFQGRKKIIVGFTPQRPLVTGLSLPTVMNLERLLNYKIGFLGVHGVTLR